MKINHLQMPERVVLDEATSTPTYGRFTLEALERGYGITLGNSLRRILISSLPGTAITAIKVNDIPHEFTAIKGVVEDLSEIILNLKEVRFKDVTKSSNKIEFKLAGPKIWTAKDIQDATADFEILNPDLKIATLNKDAKLNIELKIGSGIGYVPADENKKPDLALGFITMDSIFSPVLNVNYVTENTRVGQRTDYERLILEVSTNGAITPTEAIVTASKILKDHLTLYLKLGPETELESLPDEEEDEEFEKIKKILLTPVDELDLTVRSQNCLRSAEIKNIADLVSKHESEMLHFRNFGRKSLAELGDLIDSFGLSFGMDVSKYIKNDKK